MNLKISAPFVLSFLLLGACSDTTDFDFDANRQAAADAAPAPPVPFPNTALFAGSVDGTLNIPLSPEEALDFGNPQAALNTLDGFSVSQPMQASFDVPEGTMIDPATVVLGETVFVYKVNTTQQFAVTGITAELVATDVQVASGIDTILVVPVVPLEESTSYMIVVTNGVKIQGDPLGRSPVNSVYRLVSGELPLTGTYESLEGLRQLTGAMLAATTGRGYERTDVINIWTTRTQSITPVMQAVKTASQAGGAIVITPSGLSTNVLNAELPEGSDPVSPGFADIYVGSLEVPYYLTAPAGPNDPAGISSFWRGQGGSFLTAFNDTPVESSKQVIPVLMTAPNAASGQTMPAGGWPVAIFVHGITRDRTDLLALADRMAGAGFAVIAIDQAMHGVVDETNGFFAGNSNLPNVAERHFGIDLVNNDTGEPVPDGVVDPSGRHYYSPAFLLTTRDNLRQSVADLMVLSASLGNITAVPLDTSRKALIGYSLGGSTATTFAAFEDNLKSVSLVMPAAGMVQTTIASPEFRDDIIAGLAAAGIEENTPEFEQFVVAAQTIVDSADPINFGALAAQRNPIHMIELIGDQVVPNSVPFAELAGTEKLWGLMGLPLVTATTPGSGVVRFTEGAHGSLLNPLALIDPEAVAEATEAELAASLAPFNEMQTQVATFAANQGTQIVIGDSTVIQTAEP